MIKRIILIFLYMILRRISSLILTIAIFLTVSTIYAQVPTQEELQESFDQQVSEGEEMMNQLEEDIARQNEENVSEVEDSFGENVEKVAEVQEDSMDFIAPIVGLAFLGSSLASIFIGLFAIILIGIAIGGLVFNIMMIVDCINREFKDRDMWLIILIVGAVLGWGIIVSLLYYFMVKKKLEEGKESSIDRK